MRTTRFTALAAACAVVLVASGCSNASMPESGANGAERTVTDAAGTEVAVPENPETVVTTHYAATQAVHDLGVTPAGTGVYEEGVLPEDAEAELSQVPVVTSPADVFIEEIAELEPDLILAPNITEEDVLSQLESIAPVYQFTLRGGDRANWSQRVDEVADALNRAEESEQLRSDLEARQGEISQTYADVIDGRTVGVIDSWEENNFYAWGEDNMAGTLLMPLGFTWLPALNELVAQEPEPEVTVSQEKIAETFEDADVLFYGSNLRAETTPFMDAVQENSLYQQLPAVEAGHAYPFGKTTIAGYSDAEYSLDQIEKALQDLQG